MPANNTSTTRTKVNSTDSQAFSTEYENVTVNTGMGRLAIRRHGHVAFTDIDTEQTNTSISTDSSPCYGLCCTKEKCKNNNK